MDGYPSKFIAFMTRLGRWVRGDWQICNWIFKYIKNSKDETIKNPINRLSKYKIYYYTGFGYKSYFKFCIRAYRNNGTYTK